MTALLVASGIPVAWGTTWDAAADFSIAPSSNTATSTWSYRYASGEVRNGAYPLIATAQTTSDQGYRIPEWYTPTGQLAVIPFIGSNTSGEALAVGDRPWPTDSLNVHPAWAGMVVLSWLSPETSLVDIEASFTAQWVTSGRSDGIGWYIERDSGADTLASGTYGKGGASGLVTLSGIAVNAGDRINFVVDSLYNNDSDGTYLTAVIANHVAPEPASLAMLALGAVALFSRRR